MDLEVVGRHALFFDDASASFMNSCYDVRHLLPPITRRRHLTRSSSSPPPQPDAALEFELDQERYLDLPFWFWV
ncbi:PREDICTED: splicing factor suppressor of white-apricot homolog [Prunus dulcis]|uniref:PREDICTED: splicing factor suppressor of white-apricot homolog n=1 Tax=Prunus dulcis TaxID=3755 RepID=A0A5E4EMG1_PRUDU|nr:PREDICTED: splicing factor suppressor of white-apricot homolog [Prunus dulcis]